MEELNFPQTSFREDLLGEDVGYLVVAEDVRTRCKRRYHDSAYLFYGAHLPGSFMPSRNDTSICTLSEFFDKGIRLSDGAMPDGEGYGQEL